MYRCLFQKHLEFQFLSLSCRNSKLFSLHPVRSISQTHYQVLGVKQTATDGEIKSAYKQLCKKLHPDVNKNDPKAHDKFTEVQNAYSTLSGKGTRYEYDQELRYGQTFGHAETDEDLLRRYRSTKHADDSYYGNRSYGNSFYGNTPKGQTMSNDPVMRALRYISKNFLKIVAFGIMMNCSVILLSQRYVKNQLDEKDKRLHAEMQYLNQHFHNHGFQKAPKIYQHGKEEPYKEANIEYIYDKPQRHKKEDFLYINKSYKEKLPGDR
ncbi:DnaJ homolog subfamily C member 4 [Mytilus galloprovincialis]|uniref:DnaJ homolog subfamily C member 4 n=1 Tax=Mytilus galloprovincialis TaxID=29158 RepID=A0A8B6DSZ2_MYTGA|nr:DnaJ homolog subfamily C member 4 [Mytilus galloprovincialis]